MAAPLFALILLGCADGGDACQRLDAPAQTYESRAACEAQQEAALQSDVSLKADYPTVTAICRVQTAARKTPRKTARLAYGFAR